MTIGETAGLIAALALLILVIFIAWFLVHLMGAVKEAGANVDQLTKDVNALSAETEAILKNSNRLLDDLNEKAEQVTPVVKALADVGQSVSDVNQASRNFVEKLTERRANRRPSLIKTAVEGMAAGVFSRALKHHQKSGGK